MQYVPCGEACGESTAMVLFAQMPVDLGIANRAVVYNFHLDMVC